MKAAVLQRIGEPLSIMDCEWRAVLPDPGQVVVKVLCAGICGSQLQEIDGIKGYPAHLPHLLGHEGCGIVGKVGYGVTSVKEGDKVVLHWRKGVGADPDPPICWHGDKLIKAGPITTFSTCTIVSENRVTKIDDDVPNDLAALLGCCLSTALAIVENEAKIKPDERVIVMGCGGVGLALILAAKMITPFVGGIDRIELKRCLVESLGAQFGRWVTPMVHANVVIDTVGGYNHIGCDRYISLQPGGTSAGGFLPTVDIPRYVQMWRDGELDDYPKLITHRISLDEINKVIQLMREGKAGRVMIEM